MKTFDNLAVMRTFLPDAACEPTARALAQMQDYIKGPIEQASITSLFGAPVCLIEQVEELSAVLSFDVVDGRRVSLADSASGAFDVAEWIDDGRFARFVTIETADGGPQYLVPSHIADQVRFVRESIERNDMNLAD